MRHLLFLSAFSNLRFLNLGTTGNFKANKVVVSNL